MGRKREMKECETTPVWWVRYFFPEKHADDKRIAAKWPGAMRGWITGHGGDDDDGYLVWCARVVAPTEADAKEIVSGCYGPLRSLVRWDSCSQREPGWWPPAGRFPR